MSEPVFPGWVSQLNPNLPPSTTTTIDGLKAALGTGDPKLFKQKQLDYRLDAKTLGIKEYGDLKLRLNKRADDYRAVMEAAEKAVAESAAVTKKARQDLNTEIDKMNGAVGSVPRPDIASVNGHVAAGLAACRAIVDRVANRPVTLKMFENTASAGSATHPWLTVPKLYGDPVRGRVGGEEIPGVSPASLFDGPSAGPIQPGQVTTVIVNGEDPPDRISFVNPSYGPSLQVRKGAFVLPVRDGASTMNPKTTDLVGDTGYINIRAVGVEKVSTGTTTVNGVTYPTVTYRYVYEAARSTTYQVLGASTMQKPVAKLDWKPVDFATMSALAATTGTGIAGTSPTVGSVAPGWGLK